MRRADLREVSQDRRRGWLAVLASPSTKVGYDDDMRRADLREVSQDRRRGWLAVLASPSTKEGPQGSRAIISRQASGPHQEKGRQAGLISSRVRGGAVPIAGLVDCVTGLYFP